ncbi:urease accessory protein UreD [Segnochrobactrum spirostomi]|uniref:Urease accessory protein UreD n=1 Tax=Segnochrobactrum spirostomi TaxID=2608987 RepID=A0A6A7Y237_9HYPH|nr:urease accessory protein UreD [Segnochrobactrum spirostomi]MQT12447.1 urease accessory protein UreD [Segnochrobactrum spirostomi]
MLDLATPVPADPRPSAGADCGVSPFGTAVVTEPSALRLPDFVRARGGVRLAFAAGAARTYAHTVAERGSFRVRMPRLAAGCEAVLINTGGGLTGGDRMEVEIASAAGTEAVVTTQAAEKIYRSDGPATEIETTLRLDRASRLAWLPQETILFDRARLARRLTIEMSGEARLLLAESMFFGRRAMGERLTEGVFHDRWRLRRDGRLIFAEDVRLDGALDARLARAAIGAGAVATGTILLAAPEAESRLEEARALLADTRPGPPVERAATAFGGLLVIRLVSADAQALRDRLVHVVEHLRGQVMPRSW